MTEETRYPVAYLRHEPETKWIVLEQRVARRLDGIWFVVKDPRPLSGARRIFVPFSSILYVDYGPVEGEHVLGDILEEDPREAAPE